MAVLRLEFDWDNFSFKGQNFISNLDTTLSLLFFLLILFKYIRRY